MTANVPENYIGEFVAFFEEFVSHGLEHGHTVSAFNAVIKFHIGDDIYFGGEFFLREFIFNSGAENEVENCFEVGICDFAVSKTVFNFFVYIISPYFDKSGVFGEGNEMICKFTCRVFSEVYSE